MKRRRGVSPGKLAVVCLWLVLIIVCFVHRDELTIEASVSFTPKEPVRAAAVMLGLFTLKGCTVMTNGNALYAASGVMFPLWCANAMIGLCGAAMLFSLVMYDRFYRRFLFNG